MTPRPVDRRRNGQPAPAPRPEPALDVSVVVPLYNERDNVVALHAAVTCALRDGGRSYELLLVDDGSTDGTREALRALAKSDPRVRVVLLRRNYGQTAAMSCGFDHARGRVVVTMDGDLQNDPVDIPRLIAELDNGYDIVCGWRKHRKDAWLTRLLPSRIANLLLSRATNVPIHDTGCSLKAYRSWVVSSLTLYSDMHRFIAALAVGAGARIAELPVRHHARRFGKSKYGVGRVFRVATDLIVIKMLIQFAAHPIRWFTLLAVPLFVASPLLFVLGTFKVEDGKLLGIGQYYIPYMMAWAIVSLVALNILLLGFLAELQMKASRFFQRRVRTVAREAAR
jgi:glycosyltransferase involved in cell wall biosynthesis